MTAWLKGKLRHPDITEETLSTLSDRISSFHTIFKKVIAFGDVDTEGWDGNTIKLHKLVSYCQLVVLVHISKCCNARRCQGCSFTVKEVST